MRMRSRDACAVPKQYAKSNSRLSGPHFGHSSDSALALTEAETVRVLGTYFRAEAIPKILDERIPAFGGRTVREVAQNEPDRFIELLERYGSFVPVP